MPKFRASFFSSDGIGVQKEEDRKIKIKIKRVNGGIEKQSRGHAVLQQLDENMRMFSSVESQSVI